MELASAKSRRWLAFSLLLCFLGSGCFDCMVIAEGACIPAEGCSVALAYYQVVYGDTLDSISQRFQTEARNVQDFNNITQPNNISAIDFLFVPFRCLCNGNQLGFTFLYEVQSNELIEDIANQKFGGLTKEQWIETATPVSDPLSIFPGFKLRIPVNCSCGDPSIGKYGLFTTYAVQDNDTLAAISMKFNVSQQYIVQYNSGIDWQAFTPQGHIVFVPFTGRQQDTFLFNTSGLGNDGGRNTKAIIAASVGGGITILIVGALGVSCFYGCLPMKDEPPVQQAGSFIDNERRQGASESNIIPSFPSVSTASDLTTDRSVEFSYEELAAATSDFSDSMKIGQGGYGAVYYGVIRGQKLAIKRMNLQATREFLSELKILTHVHHTNLVQLIGFCTVESLFLVYEFVENGTLSDHLHGSGFPTLSWTSRIRIALDAARGLEYIHEHTKPTYIHRDVKSSNILIDKDFHAKVADFGLTKLTESGVGSFSMTMPTRIAGTFGYMSPEYAQFGEVSPEVDVYSFGVVLFEIISAKEAVVRSNMISSNSPSASQDKKGLAKLFETVLKDPDGMGKLRSLVDPTLGDDYPRDSAWKMAQLAGACTLENPLLRPKMRTVVVALMQLLSSIEDPEPQGPQGYQVLGSLLSRV